jgi:predicted nucleic acid-binding protein
MSAEFCDTNVMVYANDATAGVRHHQAKQLLQRLWVSGDGVLSIQVLQELFVALTRKIPHRLSIPAAREIVADMSTWRVIEPTRGDVLEAIDATVRWQLSFWDAMVLTAAKKAQASTLWSEDLNDGQSYDGTVVHNPFTSK